MYICKYILGRDRERDMRAQPIQDLGATLINGVRGKKTKLRGKEDWSFVLCCLAMFLYGSPVEAR